MKPMTNVRIGVDTLEILRIQSEREHRTMAAQLTHLILQEEKRSQKPPVD